MKKMKPFALKQIYRVNEETKAYMIEISLDDYDELFNGWDASVIRRKELEPELLDYMVSASYEISLKYPVELWFYLDPAKENNEREIISVQSIVNNFKTRLHFNEMKLRSNYRKILTYILMSTLFLLFAYLMPKDFDLILFINIIVEGLFIGGWVLLWEAFSLFFFDSHDLRIKKKHLTKLKDSKIYFKYKKL
jgi:hypothetical protein